MIVLKLLYKRLLVLLILIIIFLVIYYSWITMNNNLLSELIWVGITIIFVDLIFEIREYNRYSKILHIALKQITMQYNRMISNLNEQYKSATGDKKASYKYIDFFDSNVVNNICAKLDLYSDAPIIPKCNWWNRLFNFQNEIKNNVNNILDKYIYFLDEDLVSTLEAINGSIVFVFYSTILTMMNHHNGLWQKTGLHWLQEQYIEYINHISKLKNILSKYANIYNLSIN